MSTVLLSPRRFATEAFDTDLDSLEEGKARELIASEFMSAAAASSEWTCCTLRRPRKCEFRLEDAQGRFMLGAVKDSDGELSVSGYDAPPASASRRRRGAVLRRRRGPAGAPQEKAPLRYDLLLCVGAAVVDRDGPLVEVYPRTHRIGASTVDVRGYAIRLRADPRGAGEAHYTRDLAKLATAPATAARSAAAATVALRSRLPAWDDRNQCMSLKFGRSRVKLSSSKNVLVYGDDALRDGARAPHADEALLQLGKRAKGEFALDFKAPLSPLAAFAIALAAFDSKTALRARRR